MGNDRQTRINRTHQLDEVPTLKEYKILINGKPYEIKIAKQAGAPFSVKVNDKPAKVKVESISYEAPFSVEMHENVYKVELKKIDKMSPFLIKVNSIPFNVKLEMPARKILSRVSEPSVSVVVKETMRKAVEEGAVTAPMAGKIVSVKVKKGDSVKLGEVLCVLEAMKMENEITAPKAGLIQEVKASEGMPVNEGTIIVVIK
ncbi:MAG: biotin/lipoyl-binding protein [Candidatus Bathyarchaeota archaeon]|nr:biotin/lipoyl-binding protein [Candidatus Bathyarchaeota archaeon]